MADVDYGLPAVRIAETHFRYPQCTGHMGPGVGLLHVLHCTATQGAEEAARQLCTRSADIAEPFVGRKRVQSVATLVNRDLSKLIGFSGRYVGENKWDTHITTVTEDYLVSELPFRLNILSLTC